MINNKGYDGAKADLWSCGVILFVLMAGYLPFEEPNLMALYKKIFKADFTCPPWFSSSAKQTPSIVGNLNYYDWKVNHNFVSSKINYVWVELWYDNYDLENEDLKLFLDFAHSM